MSKRKIKVHLNDKEKIVLELETKKFLSEIRKELFDYVIFPFIFLDDNDNEIPKEKESTTKLEDILDGKNITLKKEKIKRVMLGRKVESIGGLDFYVYPQVKLTNEEKDSSSNIMFIGETGVGKSTLIHSFINYIEGIQLEENNRYFLFDEKSLQEEYQKKTGKIKAIGCSITDVPAIYNIETSEIYKNFIRLIDTQGFEGTRSPIVEKLTKDIENLFNGSEIESLNAICLLFKANQIRVTDTFEKVINNLFILFGKKIKNNIIIIFTFADNFKNIKGVTNLRNKEGIFYKILGNIDEFPYFAFNSLAYFCENKNDYKKIYENNIKNFRSLLKYTFSLNRISLESTKKNINIRMFIRNNIINLCYELKDLMIFIDATAKNQKRHLELQKELEKNILCDISLIPYEFEEKYIDVEDREVECDEGWFVLYCNNCNRVCHKKCKGSKEGWHSSLKGCFIISEINHDCTNCQCNENDHRIKKYYIIKKDVTKTKTVIRYKVEENIKQSEEEKNNIKGQIKKQLEIMKKEEIEKNKAIHNYLKEGIDCLFQLAIKNNKLNLFDINKNKEKYGFIKEILTEQFKDTEKNKIFDIFYNLLDNIEKYCENDITKEEAVNKMYNSLLISQKEN